MRTKRVTKFKRYRRKKVRNIFIFALLLPCMSIFAGYILTSLLILPAIAK